MNNIPPTSLEIIFAKVDPGFTAGVRTKYTNNIRPIQRANPSRIGILIFWFIKINNRPFSIYLYSAIPTKFEKRKYTKCEGPTY